MSLQFFPAPTLSELEIRKQTREFCEKYLRPRAIDDDEKGVFPKEAFTKLCDRGFSSLAFPKEYGGGGHPFEIHYACLEELARASSAIAVAVGVTNLTQGGILAFGNERQKTDYLRPLIGDGLIGAFSLSEPQAGSDAASLNCSAKRADGGYVVNGTKLWCSNAGFADLYLLMARTGEGKNGVSAFIVPQNTKGFRLGKEERKLGLRSSSLRELHFENCFIPETQRLGQEGDGLKVALSQLDAGRITIGVVGVALAIEAIERAWRLLRETELRGELALLYSELQAVRSLVRTAALERNKGKPVPVLAAQVKLLGSDIAMKVTNQAVSLVGPEGAKREWELERLMRDAKALQIVEGTNQIQQMVITREMEGMFS